MAWIWVERGEDRELLRVTRELAAELAEELEEEEEDDSPAERQHFVEVHGARTLENILAHELEEVLLREPRAAVRMGNEIIAGDSALPDPLPGQCLNVAEPARMRVCSSSFGERRVALAKSARGEVGRRDTFLGSVFLGALAAAFLGWASSLAIAKWALEPFNELLRKVRAVKPERPRAEELGGPAPYVELEQIRQGVVELVLRLADELNRAQAFASQAAHELRTPLAALRMQIELMIERMPALNELNVMHRKLTGLGELIERLLALGTPGAELEFTGRAVDLSDTFAEVLRELAERGARVELLQTEDPLVRGDEQLLRTLLFNALDNALKFSKGAVDDRVVVEIFQRAGKVIVRVTDRGIGMSETEQRQALVAFYRSPRARAQGIEGYGIGVALMWHVVQAHGGALRYLPADRGTILEIELPRFA